MIIIYQKSEDGLNSGVLTFYSKSVLTGQFELNAIEAVDKSRSRQFHQITLVKVSQSAFLFKAHDSYALELFEVEAPEASEIKITRSLVTIEDLNQVEVLALQLVQARDSPAKHSSDEEYPLYGFSGKDKIYKFKYLETKEL